MADMKLDIKIIVVHPVGVIQIKRQAFQLAPKHGRLTDSVVDLLQDLFEANFPAFRR